VVLAEVALAAAVVAVAECLAAVAEYPAVAVAL